MKQPDWTKDNLTVGDKLGPAMQVQTQEEADEFLTNYIAYMMKHSENYKTEESAKECCLGNIGYYTGYCNAETAQRVLPLFKTAHPIFGQSMPTPVEAFKEGELMGEKLLKKNK